MGLGEGDRSTLLLQRGRQQAWRGRDARLSRLLLGTSPKSMVFSRGKGPFRAILAVGILSEQLLEGGNTQTDCNKIKNNFGRK